MIGPRKRNVQRGRGIGSILSSIFRKIAPFAKTILNIGKKAVATKPVQEVLRSAKSEALKTGVQIADDALQGKNIKESIRSNAQSAAKSVAQTAIGEAKKMLGDEPKPKKFGKTTKKRTVTTGRSTKKTPKRRKKDVFSE